MKERPILFNSEMVRAILEGRKTQTRRVIKPQPRKVEDINRIKRPYGQVGDTLWVRETHRFACHSKLFDAIQYRADKKWCKPQGLTETEGYWFSQQCDVCPPFRSFKKPPLWRPSIFMPRWASRILLEVTDVRVERVQDIGVRVKEGGDWSEIFAEGISQFKDWNGKGGLPTPLSFFIKLWDSINEKRGFSWKTNPFVWVVGFRRVEA